MRVGVRLWCNAPRRRFNSLILTRSARSSSGRPGDQEAAEEKEPSGSQPTGPSQVYPAAQKSEGGAGSNPALFVLPLFRKPAFPGFYQVIQVGDKAVLNFLVSLRKNGQAQYLGGFLTKAQEDQRRGEARDDSEQSASASRLRRDAGMVDSVSELESVGTILQVVNMHAYPNVDGGHITVIPHKRVQMKRTVSQVAPSVPLAVVSVEYMDDPVMPKEEEEMKAVEAVIRNINSNLNELLAKSVLYKEQHEKVMQLFNRDDPQKLAYLVAGMSMGTRAELQAVLEEQDMLKRLKLVESLVQKDVDFTRVQSKVKNEVEGEMSKDQRREMLMAQMKQIMKELGIERDEKEALVLQFADALKDKTVPEEVQKVIDDELAKLSQLEPSSSEFNVSRTYLEWLTCLPWGQTTQENRDISKAEKILNEDHYGLEDVKERILEHIAVNFLQESTQGKIMCLVGPPGVGKTSISKSIARALERKFYRFSVGGLSDASEIRGHRRTYVGAMPGKLVQCLKVTQSSNPVILIDEIDKLGKDFRGDPSAALLEVLDPEQNSSYRDHYLDVPLDLSKVLFVCTANELDTIPGPLLDRMEVIRIAGYVFEEKLAIANQYLIPSTMEENGVGDTKLSLEDEAVRKMIRDYAREAGVRQLRKLLDKVSRKVALSMVRKKEEEHPAVVVGSDNLTTYIGQPVFLTDRLFGQTMPPGVVMGLAWTNMGGATLFIEARGRLPLEGIASVSIEGSPETEEERERKPESSPGEPSDMQVTGQLGTVMNESSSISLTYARMFIRELDPERSFLDKAQIHLNVPEGATPKDGPSAGVTMAVALVSLAMDIPVRSDVAMTGELTLMGKVLKVGGIQEKVIAARRENVKTVLMPRGNEADYLEIKEYLRAGLTAHFVDHFDDVYRYAFEGQEAPPLPFEPRGLAANTIVTPADALPPPLPEVKSAEQPGL